MYFSSPVGSGKITLVAIIFSCFPSHNLCFSLLYLPWEYYISNSVAVLFLFVCFVCFLISYKSCWSDSCFFLHSLSVIFLFFLFFRCRSNTEISKNVQCTPGQCPPSLDTTDACSLFPRNVNCLTVRPVSICSLGNLSVVRQSPFLPDWPSIRLMFIWPSMTSRSTKLNTSSHWGLWFLSLGLWIDTSHESPSSKCFTIQVQVYHFAWSPLSSSKHEYSLRCIKNLTV